MNRKILQSLKILSVVLLLYFFLLSIKLLGVSFQMFGKGFAEHLITSYSNPFLGLFTGILATSIVQSSSTTTSLIVGLVGGGLVPIAYAIPMIMGANVGTTVTNTLVSLTFVTRKEDFRRAFSAATVHDFFNMWTIIVFFPLEIKFHIIQNSALFLTKVFEGAGGITFTSPLKLIIDPVTQSIKHFLTSIVSFHEAVAGTIMLILAVIIVATSLIYLVKTMRSLVISQTESFIDRYLFRNAFTAIVLGIVLTIAVQSSSVTTSFIVPLVASGVISLRRAYPYTLGANIGTTFTAILASLATISATGGSGVNTAGVTIAFTHFTFNIYGVAIFYPLRRLPIFCARRLSDLATKSKKWVLIYVIVLFFILPLLIIFLAR